MKNDSNFLWNRTFTGQIFDKETGLILYRNRYCNAILGRFVNRDPIGFRGGDANVYRYVGNAPKVLSNPFGLKISNEPKRSEACRIFKKWLQNEMKDREWISILEQEAPCPCEITMSLGYFSDSITIPGKPGEEKNWDIESRIFSSAYHPTATLCMRSRPINAGQWYPQGGKVVPEYSKTQCCYDEYGKLLTEGPVAGTADKGILGGETQRVGYGSIFSCKRMRWWLR